MRLICLFFFIVWMPLAAVCADAPKLTPMNAPLKEESLMTITCQWQGDDFPSMPELSDAASRKATHGIYHYRLWLPKGYLKYPKRHWPCMFITSWAGNAKMGVMADRLKKSGYVVVLLVEARNGSWLRIAGDFLAAHDDVVKRVRIQEGAKFATGFSGGARACAFEAQLRPGFGGIILQGAGAPYHKNDYLISRFSQMQNFMVAMVMPEDSKNYVEGDGLRAQLPSNIHYHAWFVPGKKITAEGFDKALSWVEHGIYVTNPEAKAMKPTYKAYFWRLCAELLAEKNPWKYDQICEKILELVHARKLNSDFSLTAAIGKVRGDFTRLEHTSPIIKERKAQEAWADLKQKIVKQPPMTISEELQKFQTQYPKTTAAAVAEKALNLVKSTGMQCEEVPIKIAGGKVFVTVNMGGVKKQFMVDTGAGQTFIFPKTYAELKVQKVIKKAGKKTEVYGVNGSQVSERNILPELSVGKYAQKNLPVEVSNMGNFKMSVGQRFEGILGDDFMRHYDVEFDFPALKMRLYPLKNSKIILLDWLIGNNGTPFHAQKGGNVQFFAKIDGKLIPSVLDTGSDVPSMSPLVAESIGINVKLLDSVNNSSSGIGGKTGSYDYRFHPAKTLEMAGQKLKINQVYISIYRTNKGRGLDNEKVMLAGLSLYQDRLLFLSFEKSRFYFLK